eukprot:9489217-Pyramimonas_sp.AAC.1
MLHWVVHRRAITGGALLSVQKLLCVTVATTALGGSQIHGLAGHRGASGAIIISDGRHRARKASKRRSPTTAAVYEQRTFCCVVPNSCGVR